MVCTRCSVFGMVALGMVSSCATLGATFHNVDVGGKSVYEITTWNNAAAWQENAVPGLQAGDDIVFPDVWCGYYQLVNFPAASTTNLHYGAISGSETTMLRIPVRDHADLTVDDPSGYRGAWTFAGHSAFTVGSGAASRPIVRQLSVASGLELVADPAKAEEVIVSNLVSRGQLVKTGAAPLAVGATAGVDSSLLVREGAVRILARPVTREAACTAALAKAFIHIDASDASTRTVDGSGRVTRIDDVRGNGRYAVPPTIRRDGKTAYTFAIPGPRLETNAQNGRAVLDFGPLTATTPTYDANNTCTGVTFPNGYPADHGSAALVFSARAARVREVFIVAADYAAQGPFMSFAPDCHNWEFSRDTSGYLFSRGGGLAAGNLAWGCARGGDIRLNGGRILNTFNVAGTDFKLISYALLPYAEVDGVYTPVAGLCYRTDSDFGGLKIGEFLAFTENLSEVERASVCRHLVEKWGLEPRGMPAFQSVAAAGTAEIATETGGEVRVPEIHASGEGVVKKGEGDLAVEGLLGRAAVRVEEGNFIYSGALAPSANPQPATGAYRHFDASDAGSIVSEGGAVTRWNDTRGAEKGCAVTITSDLCKQKVAYGAPTVLADTLNGRAVLDFGTWSASAASYANGAGMVFEQTTTNVPNVRTGFLVASRKSGMAFLLGGTTDYGFHPTFNRFLTLSYAAAPLLAGRWFVNGVPCDITTHYLLDSGSDFALYTFEATEKVIAENFGADRMKDGPVRLGGIRLGEVILYDRALTAQERIDTEAYLLKRWFAQTHPCSQHALTVVDTTAGAHFTKTGSGTLSVDAFSGAGSVHVAEGMLKAEGNCTALLSGAALHLDASAADTVTVADDATYGKVVTEWRDVRDSAPLKAVPFTVADQLKPPAWQTDGTAYGLTAGMPYVSCRSHVTFNAATALHDASAFYLADGSGAKSPLKTVREGFAVVRLRHTQFLFGDVSAYHFHRNDSGPLLNKTYAHVSIKSNAVWHADADVVDGFVWNPTTNGASSPFYVISFGITNAASSAVTVGQLGRDRGAGSRVGGIDYAEVILFDKTLSSVERLALQGMLVKKWKGLSMPSFATPAALEVAAGATADFGAQTLPLAAVQGSGTVKAAALSGVNALNAVWRGVGQVDHLTVQGAVTLAATGTITLDWTGMGPVTEEDVPVLAATSVANPSVLAAWTIQTPTAKMHFLPVCEGGAICLRAVRTGTSIIFR